MSQYLKKWEFPFPQGDGMLHELKLKQVEYRRRIEQKQFEDPGHFLDLIEHFNTAPEESGSDFRLLYLKYVIISRVIAITEDTPRELRKGVALTSPYITASLGMVFRIYQFPDDFNTAAEVIIDYLTGDRRLLSSDSIPTEPQSSSAT